MHDSGVIRKKSVFSFLMLKETNFIDIELFFKPQKVRLFGVSSYV